ncbi:MAG: hypothetical protein AAGI38_23175, partial [Bacteroidota bacterium]
MRLFRPYYLFAAGLLAMPLLFLLKIDKTSFYHHYFRVIGEVEERNSHNLEDGKVRLYQTSFEQDANDEIASVPVGPALNLPQIVENRVRIRKPSTIVENISAPWLNST